MSIFEDLCYNIITKKEKKLFFYKSCFYKDLVLINILYYGYGYFCMTNRSKPKRCLSETVGLKMDKLRNFCSYFILTGK